MDFIEIMNRRPYTLWDAINQGAGTVQNFRGRRLHNKYAPKKEEAKLQNMYALTQAHQVQAQSALEYYRGQVDLVSNQTALLPKEFALKQHRVSMADFLDNARLVALQQQLNQPQQYKIVSDFGKRVQNLEHIKQQYGENSPEYKIGQQYLDRIA